jgi:serine phosphatase RsbU (regulator of sigma subunit)
MAGPHLGWEARVELVPSPTNPFARLLRVQQTSEPDAIAETLTAALAAIGGHDVVFYLADYEHTVLLPHPDVLPHGVAPGPASIEGTMAGRAFTTGSCQAAEREDGWHVWVPVRERANELGVLAMTLPDWTEQLDQFCLELGYAAAYLLMASANYTDLPHMVRRSRRMDLGAEMQWGLLPPLSFQINGTTLSGLVEPAYEVGGDAFDYAYNAGMLNVALFDAVGHGLHSASLAGLVVGAYRHGRRLGMDLPQLARAIDAAARAFPMHPAFATTVMARLHVASGRLVWMSCGHPQPIIVRHSACLPEQEGIVHGLPPGLGAHGPVVGSEVQLELEPGDGLLFYSDGVTEARDPTGALFGEDRLRDVLAREHRANSHPQEVVRRLVQATLTHTSDQLADDATMLYVRWGGNAAAAAVPR